MKQISNRQTRQFGADLMWPLREFLRLVGSEPHPVQANTDLLTFSCTNCESLQVVVMPVPPLGF